MLKNLIKESVAAPGTGTTVTLSGAQPGYGSFTAFGNAAPVFYMLTDGSQSEAQAGTVTVGSPNTLSRGTPLWNSAGTTSRLNFTGTTTAYNMLPAERAMYADASSVWQAQARRIAGLADGTALTDAAPLGQLAWRRLSTNTFSTTQSWIQFTLPAGLRRFRLEYSVVATAAAPTFLQFSIDGGTNWKAGASDYSFSVGSIRGASVVTSAGSLSYVPLGDTPYTAGAITFGSVEFDGATGFGTDDSASVIANPSAVISRWAGGFYTTFGTAPNAVRFGAVGTTLGSGVVSFSGATQ